MKKSIFTLFAALALLASCGSDNDIPERIGIKFVDVPAGSYTDAHGIRHEVSEPFRIGATEVTNDEFCRFLYTCGVGGDAVLPAGHGLIKQEPALEGQKLIETRKEYGKSWGITHISFYKWEPESGFADFPVIGVTWYGAKAFCLWCGGDLPTEDQWALACAGQQTGDATAWSAANSETQTHPVAKKQPSKTGAYDMLGNLSEWTSTPTIIIAGYDGDSPELARGYTAMGGNYSTIASPEHKIYAHPATGNTFIGFRCCLPAKN